MPGRILVVDDEPAWSTLVSRMLRRQSYNVVVASDADDAVQQAKVAPPDLVILDVQLKGLSGLEVCRWLRGNAPTATVPILMLTVRQTEHEKVAGLEAGADDYLTKPFGQQELVARVKALLRRARSAGSSEREFRAKDITINLDRHEVLVGGHVVDLRPKEFALLALFLEKQGRVLSKEFLIQSVWGDDAIVTDPTLAQHIKNLRAKLGRCAESLETIDTIGYKFLDR